MIDAQSFSGNYGHSLFLFSLYVAALTLESFSQIRCRWSPVDEIFYTG